MSKIGLLADSHGQAQTTRRAVQALLGAGAQCLIHLGDVGGTLVLDELVIAATASASENGIVEVHVVFGNTDGDVDELSRHAASLGLHVDHPVGRLVSDGRELAFLHGHDSRAMEAQVTRGVTWLCYGHTHRALDSRQGRTRLINPGALYRAAAYSAAVLDTAADDLVFLAVPRE